MHPTNRDTITTNAVKLGVQYGCLEYCGPAGVGRDAAAVVPRCAATVVVITTMAPTPLSATGIVVAKGDSWRTVLSTGSAMAASVVAEDSAVGRLNLWLEPGTYGVAVAVAAGDPGEACECDIRAPGIVDNPGLGLAKI